MIHTLRGSRMKRRSKLLQLFLTQNCSRELVLDGNFFFCLYSLFFFFHTKISPKNVRSTESDPFHCWASVEDYLNVISCRWLLLITQLKLGSRDFHFQMKLDSFFPQVATRELFEAIHSKNSFSSFRHFNEWWTAT